MLLGHNFVPVCGLATPLSPVDDPSRLVMLCDTIVESTLCAWTPAVCMEVHCIPVCHFIGGSTLC
jgi:hypothetical protein